jgi:competence/damage-inducible protein CinA-like protein
VRALARPRAAIVVTGSEIVRGQRSDRNGPFLARELLERGLEPGRITVVGDREDELEAVLREALEADLCVVSGGLGPTHDDRTIELIARVTGRPLAVVPELEREIAGISRAYAERLRRPYAEFEAGVRKQASLPQGAVSLGLAGTAPGVLLEQDGRVALALPGPPPELQRLWRSALETEAVRRVLARVRAPTRRVLRFFGASESTVARALADAGGERSGVEATICVHEFEIQVDLVAAPGAEARADELEEALAGSLGRHLFARDERPVEEIVLGLSRARGLTLATAESCTGGLVAARLTSIAGASEVFLGGLVVYSDGSKREQLGVPDTTLRAHGAVSAETAAAMARGARERLGADVAASVTGIAGPGGGTPSKPVGRVYVHVEGPEGEIARELDIPGGRESVRRRATATTLHLLRRLLLQSRDDSA